MDIGLKPLQALRFETLEDGRVLVIRPKFLHPRWRWLVRMMAKPDFRVKLDEKGSFIWGLCDGQHSVAEICAAVRERFGEDHTDERTGYFIQQLYGGGFVR
jgi:hypothetical protein